MNRETVLIALQASGAQLTTRQDFWVTRLLDKFTDKYLRFWSTIKPTPWSRVIYIAHPVGLSDPSEAWPIIAHELVHVKQWKTYGWFGMVRRYMTQNGRVHLEVPAYAISIIAGAHTVDSAAWLLKRAYLLSGWKLEDLKTLLRAQIATVRKARGL